MFKEALYIEDFTSGKTKLILTSFKKKIFCYFILMISFVLIVSCASLGNTSEIEYEEITAEKYFSSKKNDLYPLSGMKGYKITDVYIHSMRNNTRYHDYLIYSFNSEEFEIEMSSDRDSLGNSKKIIYGTKLKKDNPELFERIRSVMNDTKYNGHFSVYVLNSTSGITLTNIDGVPSQEQIEADIIAAEAERKAQEEAKRKAKEEKKAKFNTIGQEIAKNYIYHGIEEEYKNSSLFDSGALEEGHAYFITKFLVDAGGDMGGVNLYRHPNYQYVNYKSQKVRGEVVSAGKTILGPWPISVVVAGGKAPMYTPIVLGLVGTFSLDELLDDIQLNDE